MSRARRKLYRSKLTGLLEKADDEAFFRMVWATTALQSGRPERTRRSLRFPPEAATSDMTSRFAVHPWKRETMLNELLTTPKARVRPNQRNRQLNCGEFGTVATVTNALRRLEDAEDGLTLKRINVLQEMHRLGQRQFEWQRGFLSYPQLYRAGFLYGGDLARDFFSQANGFGIDQFSQACFALRVMFLDKPIVLRGCNMDEIGLSSDVVGGVLGLVSIPHAEARRLALRLRCGGGHTGYKRSLFRQYPCVAFGDAGERVYAPLPDLLTLRATSGLFYDMAAARPDVRNEISARFETYCRELLDTMQPNHPVVGSSPYTFRKNQIDTPDIRVYDQGAVSLILECKATRMSYEARFSEDPLATAPRGYEEMAKGVFQIWRFVSHHRRGFLGEEPLSENVRGVVLTLDTWLSMANTMQADVLDLARKMAADRDPEITEADQIPVIFCPIDDLEQTLHAATEASFFDAVCAATDEKFQGWQLWSVHQEIAPEVNEDRDYPFRDLVGEVLPWWDRFR